MKENKETAIDITSENTINSLENEDVQYIFNMNDDVTIKYEIGGVCLNIDSGCKLNLISNRFRVPKTIDELQIFLGLLNYINKWIPNLATMTEPLKELLIQKLGTKANIEKYWNSNQNQSFEKLKQALIKIETLGYYDVKDKTQVIADASPVGLVQIDDNGPRVIAYGN